VGLIAGVLVALGVGFWMFGAKSLLFVAGLGAFGPGILRELGWLRDQDEFQRQAAHTAGYHAYLIGGLVTAIVASAFAWSETGLPNPAEWIRMILVVLWGSWLLSSAVSYWGAPRATRSMLLTFGAFWTVFAVAVLIGDAGDPETPFLATLVGVMVGLLLIAPYFVLAWTVGRWPHGTGVALLGIAAVLLFVFRGPRGAPWSPAMLAEILLVGPQIACGIALLRTAGRTATSRGDQVST
jgi:hypothetical protein